MAEAFGLFEPNNFVLKCVCDECNQHFGVTIDRKIARDSIEAVLRVQHGLKLPSKYKSEGKRSTSHVEFMEGPVAGGWGYNIPNPDPDADVLGMMAFPQVWIGRSESGPFHRFRVDLDEVPTKDELIALGFASNEMIHIKSREVTDLEGLLRAKGFNLTNMEHEQLRDEPKPGTRLYAETVTRISHPEFRFLTKVALNYLAAVVGSREAMLPQFNAAREYARYGEDRARVRVDVHENQWQFRHRGHYVSLCRKNDLIVAQVSIFLKVQYVIVLATDASEVPFKSTAHFFDLDTRKIVEMEPLPLMVGPALKKIP